MSFGVGEPTAVKISLLRGTAHRTKVQLEWDTANEISLVGFNIYRSTTEDGEKQKLNDELIEAKQGGQMFGAQYQYSNTAKPGQRYYYWLEVVEKEGSIFTEPLLITIDHLIFLPHVGQ